LGRVGGFARALSHRLLHLGPGLFRLRERALADQGSGHCLIFFWRQPDFYLAGQIKIKQCLPAWPAREKKIRQCLPAAGLRKRNQAVPSVRSDPPAAQAAGLGSAPKLEAQNDQISQETIGFNAFWSVFEEPKLGCLNGPAADPAGPARQKKIMHCLPARPACEKNHAVPHGRRPRPCLRHCMIFIWRKIKHA